MNELSLADNSLNKPKNTQIVYQDDLFGMNIPEYNKFEIKKIKEILEDYEYYKAFCESIKHSIEWLDSLLKTYSQSSFYKRICLIKAEIRYQENESHYYLDDLDKAKKALLNYDERLINQAYLEHGEDIRNASEDGFDHSEDDEYGIRYRLFDQASQINQNQLLKNLENRVFTRNLHSFRIRSIFVKHSRLLQTLQSIRKSYIAFRTRVSRTRSRLDLSPSNLSLARIPTAQPNSPAYL